MILNNFHFWQKEVVHLKQRKQNTNNKMPVTSRTKRNASDALDIPTTATSNSTNNEPSNKTRLIVLDDTSNSTTIEALLNVQKPDPSQYFITLPAGSKAKCDPSKLSQGDFMCRPAELEIRAKISSNFTVKNQDGNEWTLGADLVGTQCESPDQYTKIEKVTMSEMVTIFKESVGDHITKVEFTKLPDEKEMAQLIRDGAKLIEQSDKSEKEKTTLFKKLYERSQTGEYRVMRGYIYRSENQEAQETETGMLKFVDAELRAQGNKFPVRPINLRNIPALTFKLTRYELKN